MNRLVEVRGEVAVLAVTDGGAKYARELHEGIGVIQDGEGRLRALYEVDKMSPFAYLVDKRGKIANKTIPQRYTHLLETIEGFGHPQGSAKWLAGDASEGE